MKVRFLNQLFVGLILVLSFQIQLSADQGLPRGKDSGPGVTYTVSEQSDPDGICYDYTTNPDHGYVSFNPFAKAAYLIGKSGVVAGEKGEIKSFILEVNLETKRVYKKFNLRVVDNAVLVAHQDPTQAVTLLNLTQGEFGCGQGISAGIGVQWGKKKEVVKTFSKKRYKVIRASSGQQLLDREENAIRRYDLTVKQKRVIATLPRQGIPLFADLNAKKSVHYFSEPERSLVRFDFQTYKKEAEIKLADNMRVVQKDSDFGIVVTDKKANKFIVTTVSGWSGDTVKRFEYPVTDKNVEDLRLWVDFNTGLGVVTPKNKIIAKKHDHFDVIRGYDHVKKLVRRIQLERGQYLAIAEAFPLTSTLLLATKETQGDKLASLSLYDLNKDNLEPLRIEN